jgi:hypothetical protein
MEQWSNDVPPPVKPSGGTENPLGTRGDPVKPSGGTENPLGTRGDLLGMRSATTVRLASNTVRTPPMRRVMERPEGITAHELRMPSESSARPQGNADSTLATRFRAPTPLVERDNGSFGLSDSPASFTEIYFNHVSSEENLGIQDQTLGDLSYAYEQNQGIPNGLRLNAERSPQDDEDLGIEVEEEVEDSDDEPPPLLEDDSSDDEDPPPPRIDDNHRQGNRYSRINELVNSLLRSTPDLPTTGEPKFETRFQEFYSGSGNELTNEIIGRSLSSQDGTESSRMTAAEPVDILHGDACSSRVSRWIAFTSLRIEWLPSCVRQ